MIRQPALIDFFKKQAIFNWQVNFFPPACRMAAIRHFLFSFFARSTR